MGRLNYAYDSRYMLTLTVRRDGASVFGRNNKYGTFPSAAAAWNLHNESFMQNAKHIVNNLKWRISYGLSGNEAIGIYQTQFLMNSYPIAMNGLSNTALTIRTMMGNDNLQWEKTKGFNTGVDFGLFNNRISGSIDVYKSNTYDLLLQQRLPNLTGFASVYSNIGKIENKGI